MRSKVPARAVAVATALVLLAAGPPAGAKTTRKERARSAAGYLASQQCRGAEESEDLESRCPGKRDRGAIVAFSPIGSTADAVVSLVAARTGRKTVARAVEYLRAKTEKGKVSADVDAGLRGKVVMALVASGRDPRAFGGHDLVQEIVDLEQPDGRYGDGTEVFSHATLMLALIAAGETPSAAATQWLVDAQCGDGGWQFDDPPGPDDDEHCSDQSQDQDFVTSDSNTTSLAVQALDAAAAIPAADPFGFFDTVRDPGKGWGFTQGFTVTDANSTAAVIQAYEAEDVPLPNGAMKALKGLQYPVCKNHHGAFAFTRDGDGKRTGPDVGATIGGILGLLKLPLPVAEREIEHPALLCSQISN